jgi:hypothetical protein
VSLHVASPDTSLFANPTRAHTVHRERVPCPVEELEDKLKELGHDEL